MTINRNGLLSADLEVPVVLPTLNLDFANSQSLDERITFTRGSIGTRVNRNGLIETIPANQPRFDFDPVTGECKGLLIEESRSNLVTDSIILSNFTDKTNTTVIDNSIISPDGTQNASRIQEIVTATTTPKNISRLNVTTAANTAYTISGYFKAGERTFVGLSFRNNTFWGTGVPSAIFNLATGTLFSTSGTINATSITYVGNGWYRCSVTATRDSNGTVTSGISIGIQNQLGANNFNGASGYGLYAWGIQMEAGAFPTSFIPTSGSTVTRSADNASMTGTNFSSWYNQGEGTIVTTFKTELSIFNNIWSINCFPTTFFGTSSPYYRLLTSSGNMNSQYNVARINSQIVSALTSLSQKVSQSYNILSTKQFAYFNGIFRTPSLPNIFSSPPPFNQLEFGKNVDARNTVGQYTIARLSYYPRALSPSQLQYLTT